MAKQTQELSRPAEGEIMEQPRERRTVKDLLESKMGAMAAVATKHLPPEKLVKIVGVMMSRVPKLGECTPLSLLNCVMTCAELGLAPNTLGDAYLIPYENRRAGTVECQLIVGYRGLVTLARRSGMVSTITAEVVYEGDQWDLEFGLEAKLVHKPNLDRPKEAKIKLAYAICKFKDGSHQLAVMTKDEIDQIRARSKASGSGPWVTDYSEMAKKTVLRRLCKLLPLTVDIQTQIAVQDRTEFDFDDISSPSEPTPTGAEGLASRLIDGESREVDTETGEVIPPADSEQLPLGV